MSSSKQLDDAGAAGDGVGALTGLINMPACPAAPICKQPEVHTQLPAAVNMPLGDAVEPQETPTAQPIQMPEQETLQATQASQQQQTFQPQQHIQDYPQDMQQSMHAKQYQQQQQHQQQHQVLPAQPIKTQEIAFARPVDPDADNLQNPPCYLPQPGDNLPNKDQLKAMGPVGPWATGKVDWSPLAGLTGTRPVVDRYSITRYSPNEWRAKNQETLKLVNSTVDNANKNHFSANTEFMRLTALVNKTQNETTEKVRQRTQLIGKWKNTLENAIKATADEISMMEQERIRLRKSLVIFGVPESIAKECLEKRAGRPDTELVRDKVEEELINELALIAEIRQVLKKTLEDFEAQQAENRAARQRLEYDWSDKKEAYEIDTTNLGLNNYSKTIMFRPGAVRQPPEQASEQYWEHFSTNTLEECEKCRQKSVALRATLNSILNNAARDIRTQADVVEKALTSRINCTQEAVQRFENELSNVLKNLAETETRIGQMHLGVRSFDSAMKVAQTRMYNRSYRPNVENCRDKAQQDLIDEVATIQSSVSAMLYELEEAEKAKINLMNARSNLEREIMLKQRTLWTDRERCMRLRSHYPSASSLSGASQI